VVHNMINVPMNEQCLVWFIKWLLCLHELA
jgi:hypothetical protein